MYSVTPAIVASSVQWCPSEFIEMTRGNIFKAIPFDDFPAQFFHFIDALINN